MLETLCTSSSAVLAVLNRCTVVLREVVQPCLPGLGKLSHMINLILCSERETEAIYIMYKIIKKLVREGKGLPYWKYSPAHSSEVH